MRALLTWPVVVAGLLVVPGAGCGSPECGACIEAASATFDLSCVPNDLTSVAASGPCTMPDASTSWYTGDGRALFVAVFSRSPGTCHVVLTFASGFTYSRDVTFTSQTGGCRGCPSFIGPAPSGPFTVNNPSSTCVEGSDAGDDTGHGGSDSSGAEVWAPDAPTGD